MLEVVALVKRANLALKSRDWVSGWLDTLFIRSEEQRLPLRQALLALQPLCVSGSSRFLVLETESRWTACFENSAAGTGMIGVMPLYAQELQCRTIAVEWCPFSADSENDNADCAPKGVQFGLFHGRPDSTFMSNSVRVLSLVFEDGWEFDSHGIALPCENLTHYDARLVRDKFTPELLNKYALYFGLRPFDEDFYRDRSVLLFRNQLIGSPAGLSLEEAQRRLRG